ncbi:MAG: ABC transporter substrate-binding protein [Desulfofustis sp. PB-SRB1]|nr:ABC transporter substrate-binding protein [Desulfofustis sp. PB-SRB1]
MPVDAWATVAQRIVSLGPINTENVFLLGAGDRLVGNTVYCVRPKEAADIEKVGTVMQVSVEKIISLKPDIVLTSGLTQPDQLKMLEASGIELLHFRQPVSFAQSCEQLLLLGETLGLRGRAETIIAELDKEIAAIQTRLAGLPRPRVLLQIGANPLYVSGNDSFMSDFIRLGGGTNPFAELSSGRINYERAIAANPEVIVIAMMGSETGIAAAEKKKWETLTVIKAVADNRVHMVDPNLACSPSPATFVEALKIIVGFIHPQL